MATNHNLKMVTALVQAARLTANEILFSLAHVYTTHALVTRLRGMHVRRTRGICMPQLHTGGICMP